jgi:hypothetical protein
MTRIEADEAQDWRGMDGSIAFNLIESGADTWEDCGAMMDAWLRANQGCVAEDDHLP